MKKVLEQTIPHQKSTQDFAKKLVDEFLAGEKNFTIFFEGGLGTGKTFLVREILKNFGVTEKVSSPTFIFVNEFHAGERKWAHFDLYRLKNQDEFFARGFDEIAVDETVSKFVEWPERIGADVQRHFSGKHFIVQISHGVGAGMRKIKLLTQ
ncbi:tRNA (adenosine(37)-N6)-threonylcarbamoyltransferase complex ATPase subunit type 1 TsaE [bacterium]|jgi:tRNA threonylcarbamoyladenosine biosynthesis protein TsaE|nr:tRNA (adenosine(37)-N6)-threonylcarbamoyltransferase complex ATPase subunit type 1 TsaE [bacterium]MBT6831943.1 tRNA (adenosine(37)-N6)-threonylcarbamoyltransferase complex ATPase subunit type 1 TsaE [bacterium]MBT6996639.1 tRNA (adenosine(37)-N6)-threonylcarbamoyltransferase complex ATPase subunit type 1 TsaE [bacterium]MBT7773059.1 tRNA (adenosine(37)-N6)-threonylcarbamoyltransferase complex ATPase subunit type 1 TsaE [bacterium]